jgi:hypothetical protein
MDVLRKNIKLRKKKKKAKEDYKQNVNSVSKKILENWELESFLEDD